MSDILLTKTVIKQIQFLIIKILNMIFVLQRTQKIFIFFEQKEFGEIVHLKLKLFQSAQYFDRLLERE